MLPLYYLGHPVQAQSMAQLAPQQAMSSVYYQPQHSSPGLLGPAPALYLSQSTSLPNTFCIMTLPDPTWNMDTGDLYPVTKPSNIPSAFVSTSSFMWHQRVGHPGDEVLRSLASRHFISCNKEKSTHDCHACQLGKHVKLPFYSSDSIVKQCFDIIHSDL
ncbi:ribonuclease H-like domain-containing protein [Tanacetum coccineum]